MSVDLRQLVPEFRSKIELTLARCQAAGHTLRPFFGVRDVYTQAKLWRQSRALPDILTTAAKLRKEGAPFLAHVLESVGPQHGRWATNALPGQSWHQWGEAVDCFVLGPVNRAIWAVRHPGYEVYAREAKALGLTAGLYWPTRPDGVHVQYREPGVRSLYTWAEIDTAMKEKFDVQ